MIYFPCIRKSRWLGAVLTATLIFSSFSAFGPSSSALASSGAFNAWTVDALTKVFEATEAPANPFKEIRLIAAKNEWRAGQIAIRATTELTGLSVSASPLTGPENHTIDAVNIRADFLDYITLAGPTDGLAVDRRIQSPDGSLSYPDRIAGETLVSLKPNTTQPIWYSVYIPKTASPGTYTGTVTVSSDQGAVDLQVSLQVYDVTLPDTNESDYRVDNWFSSAGWDPSTWMAMNRQYGIEQWSPEWWTLMEKYAAYMKEHRNNTIWIDPIAYLEPGTTIDAGGQYSFDWSLFDRAVQIYIDAGAMKYLHGVSIMSKKGSNEFSVQMLGNVEGRTQLTYVPAQSAQAEAWLEVYLPALKSHLEQKGWLNVFYQSGGDEPGSESDRGNDNWLYNKVHALAPGIKTIEALHHHSEAFTGTLDAFVVKQDVFDINQNYYKSRQREGYELWLYICNLPTGNFLTRNIDAPLGQVLLPHWYTFKNGMDGYLHWGFNYWNIPLYTISGQSVQVSSTLAEPGWSAANLVDGLTKATDSSQGWSSLTAQDAAHPESVTLDLGAVKTVSRVKLYPYRSADRTIYGFPSSFTVQVSEDGSRWTAVASRTGYTVPAVDGFVPELSFEHAKARYVKVEATELGANEAEGYSMRFSEIQLLNDDVLHDADSPYPGDNWLVYPDKINLGLFSSIRSEIQLEGIQDNELLRLLAASGKADIANRIAESLIVSGTQFNTNPDAIALARRTVLNLLIGQASNEIFVDPLNDLSAIYAKSPAIGLETSNPNTANGDTDRLARTENTDQFVVYYKPNIQSFEAKLYSDSTDDVDVLVSADNKKWTPVTIRKSSHVDTDWGWFGFSVSAGGFPQGTNYLKIVLKGSNAHHWAPQLGEVAITYGYEVTEKESLVENNGFEAGLWPKHRGVEIDTVEKMTGKNSAKLISTGQRPYVESAFAPIGSRKKHTFSIALKTSGVSSPDGVKVELMQVDANGSDIGLYTESNGRIQTGGTHDWSEFTIDSIDTRAAGLRVIVRMDVGVAGTVWVDDAVLLDRDLIETFTDSMGNFNEIYAKSDQWGIASANPNITGGDLDRLLRLENTDQYIVYNKPNISAFSAKLYSDSTAAAAFYASPDNQNWTLVTVTDKDQAPTDWGWYTTTKVSGAVPAGTNYLKIVIPGSNENNWAPQIGEVTISYGYAELEPESLVANSGFEAGLWDIRSEAQIDTEVRRSGQQSAKLKAGEQAQFISSSVARIAKGKSHSLSLWLKTDGISVNDGVKVEVMQVDAFGNDIGLYDAGTGAIATGSTQDWTRYALEFIPTLAPGIRVIVRTEAGTAGTVWIDDVVVADEAFEPAYTDDLDTYAGIYEKSDRFGIDSPNPQIANGDTSRLTRLENTDQYITYRGFNMRSFSAKFYSDSTDLFDLFVSSDNRHWTKLEELTKETASTANGWHSLNVSAASLPWGTNYIKIVFRGDNANHWSPQLGEISFTYGYGNAQEPSPVSLIRNGGFELGAWPTDEGTALDRVTKHGGDFSAKLTSGKGADSAYLGSHPVPVDPAKRYVLSLWAKGEAAAEDESAVEVMQLDEDGGELGLLQTASQPLLVGGSGKWQKFVFNGIQGFDVNTAALRFIVRTNGTLWVDDFVLLEDGANRAPTAVVSISGVAQVGKVLTGTYTFSDPDEGDTEGASVYRWLVGSSPDGAYAEIAGATRTSYTPTTADQGKYIKFEVMPVDNHGLAGAPAASEVMAAVAAADNDGDNGGSPIIVGPNPESTVVQQATDTQLKEGNGTIDLQAGKQLLSLPINADELLGNRGLTVQAGQASVAIPSTVLKALREQASREALDATAIIVKLLPAPLSEELGDSALKAGDTEYELELYAVNVQGKETRLSTFAEPVRIVLPYSSSQNAELAGIYDYNQTTRSWEYVGGTVDVASSAISAELRHFSKYAVMEYNKSFADIPSTHWALRAVKALAARHVVSGVDNTRFQPDSRTTRAEFTAMLARALALKPASEPVPFQDVASDEWYADAVGAAYAAGLVQGVAGDRFAPDAQITREQMATLLVRALAYLQRNLPADNPGLDGYQDRGKVSSWAVEAVDIAIQAGIMKGKKPGYFNPADQVTRAETAQAIWNLLQK